MSSRVEKALENHGKGYNCCQAVACAYADLVGVDENLILAAGEGLEPVWAVCSVPAEPFREPVWWQDF